MLALLRLPLIVGLLTTFTACDADDGQADVGAEECGWEETWEAWCQIDLCPGVLLWDQKCGKSTIFDTVDDCQKWCTDEAATRDCDQECVRWFDVYQEDSSAYDPPIKCDVNPGSGDTVAAINSWESHHCI